MKILLASSWLMEHSRLPEADSLILDALKRRHIAVTLVNPAKCTIVFPDRTDPAVEVWCGKENVMDAAVLLVRRTKGAGEFMYMLARTMEHAGSVSIDSADSLIFPLSKAVSQIERVGHVAHPKTIFAPRADAGLYEDAERAGIKAPMIVKPEHGREGEGVEVIRNAEDMSRYGERFPNTPIIVQEKIDIVAEYRVIVIGGSSLGVCEKDAGEGIDVRNAAQGATFRLVQDTEIEEYAKRAASRHQGDIFGVDVVRSKDGSLFVLECNRNPNFIAFREASGIPVEEHIADYCITRGA